jgi:hypothetical protein
MTGWKGVRKLKNLLSFMVAHSAAQQLILNSSECVKRLLVDVVQNDAG